MDKKASAAERNVAVVQGQENLTGVKEVRTIKKLKKNSESEFVVTESTRTEMLYDNAAEAKAAYKDIQNAKEDAEFDETESEKEESSKIKPLEEDENNKESTADFKLGMVINAKYVVKAHNPIDNTYYLSDKTNSCWIPQSMLSVLQNHPNFALNFASNQIVPADMGTASGNIQQAESPIDFASQQPSYKIDNFQGASGYASDPTNTKTPEMEMQTGIWAQADAEPQVPSDIKVSDTEHELTMGVNREMEHTNNPGVATEIALDHLAEDKNYYTKINKVLPEEGVEHKPERTLNIEEAQAEERGIEQAVNGYDYKSAARKYMLPEVNND